MLRSLLLAGLLAQTTVPAQAPALPPPSPARPTIVTKPAEAPLLDTHVFYYDDAFLFAGRSFADRREGAPEPALLVNSKEKNRWLQITAISTAGALLGRSWTEDPQAQKKLRAAPVGWDFTAFATRPYIDQPLRTSGSIAFPDKVTFDATGDRYELYYFSSYGVPSAETVLYVARADLVAAFAKR